MNKKLSIIVPVYNVEKYLDRCIKSIINQKLKDIEILLIDDGSTDNSGIKCNEWAKKDKRIRVFHKKNGGLSDARNYGIEKALGEYVGFVDSDDWIEQDMYTKLIDGCVKYNADIGCCNKIRVFDKKEKKETIINNCEFVTKENALLLLLLSDPSVCNKIFRRKLFRNIKFPYKKTYEDIITTPYLIDISNGMYLDKYNGYNYDQTNSNSITHVKVDIKKIKDYYNNINKIRDVVNKYPVLEEAYECFYSLFLTDIITKIYKQRNEFNKEYQLFLNDLKKINYFSNKYIPLYKKIMIFFDLHHLGWAVNIIKKLKK